MGGACSCFQGDVVPEVINIKPFAGVARISSDSASPASSPPVLLKATLSTSQHFPSQVQYEVDPEGVFYSLKVNGIPAQVPEKRLWDIMSSALHSFYKALHRNVCSGAVQRSISFRWFCD
eukprot:RCo039845